MMPTTEGLTPSMVRALLALARSAPNRPPGVRLQTMNALRRRGLISWRLRAGWSLTDAGAALAGRMFGLQEVPERDTYIDAHGYRAAKLRRERGAIVIWTWRGWKIERRGRMYCATMGEEMMQRRELCHLRRALLVRAESE